MPFAWRALVRSGRDEHRCDAGRPGSCVRCRALLGD